MRDLIHGAVWQFAVAEKSPIDIGPIDRTDHCFHVLIPTIPFVDIRQKKRRSIGAFDPKGYGFGKIVAMRNQDGCDSNPFIQLERLAIAEVLQFDILVVDELAPWPGRSQKNQPFAAWRKSARS